MKNYTSVYRFNTAYADEHSGNDEPTGALDEETGKVVLDSLIEANEKLGTTMIIVTHNPGIAMIGDRVIRMNSGKIVEEIVNKKRTKPKDIPWG